MVAKTIVLKPIQEQLLLALMDVLVVVAMDVKENAGIIAVQVFV